MHRYFPTINHNYGSPFAEMEEDCSGDYVSVDDVVTWLRQQRNVIPATGEEMAEGLLYELGENT